MFSYSKYVIVGFLISMLSVAAGCGGTSYTPAKAADPSVARETLTTVLDTWKSGGATDSLANRTPKVFVGDEDWTGGYALKEYKLKGDGEQYGNNVRFRVDLQVALKTGGPSQKTVSYLVATNPVLSVTRDDRDNSPD
jgi:hypothetical protein